MLGFANLFTKLQSKLLTCEFVSRALHNVDTSHCKAWKLVIIYLLYVGFLLFFIVNIYSLKIFFQICHIVVCLQGVAITNITLKDEIVLSHKTNEQQPVIQSWVSA